MKVLILLSLVCVSQAAVHLSRVVSPSEQQEIKNLLQTTPYTDVSHAYYALQGWSALSQGGAATSDMKKAACNAAKSASTKSLESMFYATSIVASLGANCKHEFPASAFDSIGKKITASDSDTKQIFFAVSSLANAGKKFSSEDALAALLAAIKQDDSVYSSSLALLTATRLDAKLDLKALLEAADIEDMVNQADEVDEKYLQFENDLRTTSTFIRAAYAIAARSKKTVGITEDQAIMLANFVLRSKNPSNFEQAYNVVGALGAMTAYTQLTLAKVQLVSGTSISQEKSTVKVAVTNLFSQPIEGVTVKADSVTRTSDDEVIISNVPLKKSVAASVTTYDLNMWDLKPKSGFYDITLNVIPTGGRTIAGIADVEFKVKVTTRVAILDAQVGTQERESTAGDFHKVQFPSKAQSFKADSQQKIVMTFKVQDTMDSSLMKPHQVFVLFQNVKSGQEVIFVAEADTKSSYKFEVDIYTAGKDQFSNVGGEYTMSLIIGDAAISNPILWHVADVTLSLPSSAPASSESIYAKKPEIHHLFREPEPRPPAIISTFFTFACLAPLVVLILTWLQTGVNLSNMSLAPKNLIFHAGLASIFILYYMFWTHLNMFTTLRYLMLIGAITFLAGNKVLAERGQQ